MQLLNFIKVSATREKGYVIPADNEVKGLVYIQHDDREQFYSVVELEDDEEANNSSGFF